MSLTTNRRVTAARVDALTLSFAAVSGRVTASAATRQLTGDVVRYGDFGRTSAGRLKVAPGALRFPPDLGTVKLTREHARDHSRGHIVAVTDDARPGGLLSITARAADGPDGDDALREAADRTRDGLSFDIVDAVIDGDTITSALVIAIGQVGIPAYDGMRVTQIAASLNQEGTPMTEEQRARLRELLELQNLTDEQRTELDQLQAAAARELLGQTTEPEPEPEPEPAQPQAVTASAATLVGVGGGAGPARRPAGARTQPRAGDALRGFVQAIVDGYAPGGQRQSITAALADVTFGGVGGDVTVPAWSAELWSGLAYEPEFTPLLSSGEMTSLKGEGWRWTTKPEMKDYAGNKAAIPSDPIDTEPATWNGARMAVGHDIDRAFYDFPDFGFLASYVAACRESWAVKLDGKVEAWIIANADATDNPGTATTLLKAARQAVRQVRRNKAGKASFVIVNEDDLDALLDVTSSDVPAFLELLGIDPGSFTSSDAVAAGTVIAGARAAAEVKTLPGSPIRATAQHLANAGVDEAFFGYWAIEQHHTTGIVSTTFVAAP